MVEFPVSRRCAGPARRATRRLAVPRALLAGLFAGGVAFLVLYVLSVSLYGEPAAKLPRLMAAIALGRGALEPADVFDPGIVAVGLAVHAALAMLYAVALASVGRDLPRALVPLAGVAFGAALYVANLHGFSHLFPWFAPMRGLDTLGAHALFGLLAARAALDA